MQIYVAGPYRAKGTKTVKDNIQAARKVAVEVWRSGHVAICPHLNSAFFEDDLGSDYTDKMLLDGTLDMLRRCDAILMVDGWETSEGAIAEREYAISQGIPVYTTLPEQNPTEMRYPMQCRAFIEVIMKMYRLHLTKNNDYSPANILGVGDVGLATRMWDKAVRILNLTGIRIESVDSSFSPPTDSMFMVFVAQLWQSIIGVLWFNGFRFKRIKATYSPPIDAKHESLEDSFLDAAVYSIIGLIYRMGCWGK